MAKKLRRTSQPQGVALVDWSNPITRGLVVTINPANPLQGIGGDVYTDFYGAGQSFSRKYSPQGISLSNNASLNYRIGTARFEVSKGYTTFALLTPIQNQTASAYHVLVDDTTGWVAASISIGDGTNPRFVSVQHSSPITNIAASSNYVLNKTVGVTSVSALTSQSLYINGVLEGTAANTLANSGLGRKTTLYSPSNTADVVRTHIVLVWTRVLSPSEIKSISDNPWQIFAPQRQLLPTVSGATVSLPTLGRPATDTSTGAWTSTAGSLAAAVNEPAASDAEFISVTAGSTCEMVLDNTAFPGGATQTLSYRASSVNASTLTVILKQGATTIMTRTHALTPTITLYTQTLTSGEIATIITGAISVTLTSS
jgi:hypothetical protein